MLTFGAPFFLIAAALASIGVAVLHLLRRSERRPAPLPTARFIPPQAASTFVRMSRLNDGWLLALRVVTLLLAGAGMARPIISWRSPATARVILVDRSRAVASAGNTREVMTSIRSSPAHDRIIVFDSVPALAGDEVDSVTLMPIAAKGSLSAALVAGIREGERLRSRFRQVELHLISAFAAEESDEAVAAIRSQWPGSVTLHRVAPVVAPAVLPMVETTLSVDDIVGAAIRNALPLVAPGEARSVRVGTANGPATTTARGAASQRVAGATVSGDAGGREVPRGSLSAAVTVRMIRGSLTSSDSVWTGVRGHVLVVWPSTDAADDSLRALASDSGAAIGHLAVSPFPQPLGGDARSIIWWSDGRPAALESSLGEGCIRRVGFIPVRAGDFALSLAFRRIVQRLAAPCGDAQEVQPLPAAAMAALSAPGAVPSTASARLRPVSSPLAPWLLGAALGVALIELLVRRTTVRPIAVQTVPRAA